MSQLILGSSQEQDICVGISPKFEPKLPKQPVVPCWNVGCTAAGLCLTSGAGVLMTRVVRQRRFEKFKKALAKETA